MGEEEVRAEEHVGIIERDVADQEMRVLDRLAADLEFIDGRRPDLDHPAAEAEGRARGDHSGTFGGDAGASRRIEREDRAPGAGIEEYVDVAAVHRGLRDQMCPLHGSPVNANHANGLRGGPIGQYLIAAVLRLDEAQRAIGKVEVDVGDPEYVLAQDPGDTAAKVIVADEKRRVVAADSSHRECPGRGDPRHK